MLEIPPFVKGGMVGFSEQSGKEIPYNRFLCFLEMRGNVRQDRIQRPNAKRVVGRNRNVVLPALRGGEANMTPGLPGDGVPVAGKKATEFNGAEVPGELHTVSTSSLTRCSLMIFGAPVRSP